jgi:hypothetical protein
MRHPCDGASLPLVITPDDVRALALRLPKAIEQDHHGRPSFRIDGTIFATQWSPVQLNVMLEEELIRATVATYPDACSLCFWGTRLAAVQVDLERADLELVRDLLQAAWSRRATQNP